MKNEKNLTKYPQCVADDIKRQVHELSTSVYQIRGHIKGKTLLPFPQVIKGIKRSNAALTCFHCSKGHKKVKCGLDMFSLQQGANRIANRIAEEERRVRESKGEECDMTLKNNIEGIIIKWGYQTDEVLSKDSAEELNMPGHFPGPMTEVRFWEAKCMNLESLFEQMKAPTTRKMASILDITDRLVFEFPVHRVPTQILRCSSFSAYYPCFRSMFRNVVAALNEAQDITLFLKPLTQHFQSLETSDFPDIVPQLRPLMHCICLVYSHSTFYNSPARIIVLMQETCNLLTDAGRKYLDPASLFQV